MQMLNSSQMSSKIPHILNVFLTSFPCLYLELYSERHTLELPSLFHCMLEILSYIYLAFRDSLQLPSQEDTAFSLTERNFGAKGNDVYGFVISQASKYPLQLSIIIHQSPTLSQPTTSFIMTTLGCRYRQVRVGNSLNLAMEF